LREDRRALRAERTANRNFPLPGNALGEKKVGYVQARD
jgi:hypothetical protein